MREIKFLLSKFKTLLILIVSFFLFIVSFFLVNYSGYQKYGVYRGLEIMLTPHPDDEIQGWSALSNDPSIYTIFVVSTQGEATGYCSPKTLLNIEEKISKGAIRPPYPLTGSQSQNCRGNRMALWNMMLDWSANTSRSARLGTNVKTYKKEIVGKTADLTIGSRGARIMLDLGDVKLQTADVVNAIKEILDYRGTLLPDLPAISLVTAAYYNDPLLDKKFSNPAALRYPHPDHLAVTNAGIKIAPLFTDGSWVVTHPFDPRANNLLKISMDRYLDMMAIKDTNTNKIWMGWIEPTVGINLKPQSSPPVSPINFPYTHPGQEVFTPGDISPIKNFEKVGIYQKVFGWLAFPASWVPGEYQLSNSDALFARKNFYIHVPGAGKETNLQIFELEKTK